MSTVSTLQNQAAANLCGIRPETTAFVVATPEGFFIDPARTQPCGPFFSPDPALAQRFPLNVAVCVAYRVRGNVLAAL